MLIDIFEGDGVISLVLQSGPPALSTIAAESLRQVRPQICIHNQYRSILSRHRTCRQQQACWSCPVGVHLLQQVQQGIHLKDRELRLKGFESDRLRW